MTTEKFCTKCGRKFIATGREVICPACKQAAAEESKKAAVERAKMASWRGESVPVRISGRASTVIRAYGTEKSLPFAAALDELLKQSACFKGMQMAWEDITPYKSRRCDKATSTTDNEQEVKTAAGKPQDAPQASKPQEVQDEPVKPVKQAAKVASKATTSKPQVAKNVAGKAGKKVKE